MIEETPPRESVRLKAWKYQIHRQLEQRRALRREALLELTDAERQALVKMPIYTIQQREAQDDGKWR